MSDRRTTRNVLILAAIVLWVVAAVVGFGWLAPDKPQDAAEIYQGLLALGAAFGIAGLAV